MYCLYCMYYVYCMHCMYCLHHLYCICYPLILPVLSAPFILPVLPAPPLLPACPAGVDAAWRLSLDSAVAITRYSAQGGGLVLAQGPLGLPLLLPAGRPAWGEGQGSDSLLDQLLPWAPYREQQAGAEPRGGSNGSSNGDASGMGSAGGYPAATTAATATPRSGTGEGRGGVSSSGGSSGSSSSGGADGSSGRSGGGSSGGWFEQFLSSLPQLASAQDWQQLKGLTNLSTAMVSMSQAGRSGRQVVAGRQADRSGRQAVSGR